MTCGAKTCCGGSCPRTRATDSSRNSGLVCWWSAKGGWLRSRRSREELGLLSRALGFETAPPLTGPYADKVAQILASAKAEQFKRMIDDYFELAFG